MYHSAKSKKIVLILRLLFGHTCRLRGTLQSHHNKRDCVSNHRRLDRLLSRLFRRRSKKTSKFRVTGLCEENPPVTCGFPHKGPVPRKMFPFDDIIMTTYLVFQLQHEENRSIGPFLYKRDNHQTRPINLVNGMAHKCNLPCCQCTETCSHLTSIQNNAPGHFTCISARTSKESVCNKNTK